MKRISILITVILIVSAFIPLFNIIKVYPFLFGKAVSVQPADSLYRVVIISAYLGDPYWNEIIDGAKNIAQFESIHIDVKGSYRSNMEEIKTAMEVAIASNMDGVILVGLEDPRFASIIDKATMKGIPVITVGADIPSSLRKMYIGTNHKQSGQIIAEKLRKVLLPTEKIGVVNGSLESFIQQERWRGFYDELSKTHPYIYQYMSENIALTTEDQARELLNAHPDLRVFVMMEPNSEEKVIHAIQERYSLNEITLFSFDDTKKALSLLEQREIEGVLAHSREEMGEQSVQFLIKWLKKENLPIPTHVYTDSEFRKELNP